MQEISADLVWHVRLYNVRGTLAIVKCPVLPRVGEVVYLDGEKEYRVHRIEWSLVGGSLHPWIGSVIACVYVVELQSPKGDKEPSSEDAVGRRKG